MRIDLATIIALIGTVVAFIFGESLWLPLSFLISAITALIAKPWIVSDRLGRAKALSVILKATLSVMGLYAMAGQVVIVGLIVYWIAT